MNLTDKNSPAEIETAYRFCEATTKAHAKTFYFAAKFLPEKKRRPIYAVYALCRHIDDAIDEAEIESEAQAIEAVENWKAELDAVYRGELQSGKNTKSDSQKLILLAWADLLRTYDIAQNLPLELMRGVLQDTHTKRYETFDELYVYCWRVASTVGLMSSEIFGYEKAETLEYAEALGIAMQLTNILRDIKEDALMNRIYLPQEELQKFNVTEQQISEGVIDTNFIRLIKFQIARARNYYEKSYKGIALLEPDARFTVLLALRIYSRILTEIERQNYDVFQKRAHTNFRQKIFAIPRIWLEAKNF